MNSNKILCFVGSNSSKSINVQLMKSLVQHELLADAVNYVDIREWQLPIFSQDTESAQGYPALIKELATQMKNATHVLVGTNEHNSAVSAFFKDVLDWLSRYDKTVFEDKVFLVVSTSEGGRGAISANEYTQGFFSRFKAKHVFNFSLPNFSKNFSTEQQLLTNDEFKQQFNEVVIEFVK